MADLFDIDRNLDSYIARYIRKKLFVNGMEYNNELKRFEPVKPNPTNALLRTIEEECCRFFDIKDDEKTPRIQEAIERFRKRVQETTTFDPVKELKHDSIQPSSIPVFQHVWIKEGAAFLNLLSMGGGQFLVVSTDRNTLKEGDTLLAITTPWNATHNDGFEFDIIRNGAKYIPDELPKTTEFVDYKIEYKFKTKSVDQIWFYNPPEIYSIVDVNINELEDGKAPVKREISTAYAFKFIDNVEQTMAKLKNGLEKKHYDVLLDYSRQCGVGSYVFNLIVELLDKKSKRKTDPIFTSKDWYWDIPEEVEKRIQDEKTARKIQYVKDLHALYQENLKKKLEQGKFLLIFKRSGYYSKQSEMELKGISDKLEALADEGFGVRTWAESEKSNYLKKHQVDKKDNIIIGIKVFALLAVIIFALSVFLMTKSGLSEFAVASDKAQELLKEKQYQEARDIYTAAYNNYSPGITSFLAKSKYDAGLKLIETAIDTDVRQGINDINTFLEADGGRFKEHTKELLFKLLELRPENPKLLQLKQKWMKQ